jgi:hypothetical protein
MLRHIFSLTILLASLLLAGSPAFACAEGVPANDCCPNGPLALCSIEGSTAAAPSNGVQLCCASNPAASSAFAASSNDFHKHLKRLDLPVILTSPAISPTAQVVSGRSTAISGKPFFSPSYALLYLSTGRLRL